MDLAKDQPLDVSIKDPKLLVVEDLSYTISIHLLAIFLDA